MIESLKNEDANSCSRTFTRGQRVIVSDGTPEPPKHHTRKHASWSMRNYHGYFDRYDKLMDKVMVDESGKGVMCVGHHPNHVSKLKE